MEYHCYIALGSNLGNRLAYLIQGMAHIQNRVGKILRISNPYETAAVGFDGPSFINACLQLETELDPEGVLKELQTIERVMGRTPSMDSGYQSRTLDLDLLFYGRVQMQNETLVLPHPRIQFRRFVLDPLAAIAPDWEHPILGENIQSLQKQCLDQNPITPMAFQAWLPSLKDLGNYIAIAGNIGSGKTSLTQKIASDFQIKPVFEKFEENPHLAAFYEDPESFALATETFFLEGRIKQLKQYKDAQFVSDFWLDKSLIFAQNTLEGEIFKQFEKTFQGNTKAIRQPDLLIYLDRPVDSLLSHIAKRGRPYEQGIKSDYLASIAAAYKEKLHQPHPFPVHLIDATDLDYVARPLDYILLLRQLTHA